eukprot:1519950-Rhodomonas_salina.1
MEVEMMRDERAWRVESGERFGAFGESEEEEERLCVDSINSLQPSTNMMADSRAAVAGRLRRGLPHALTSTLWATRFGLSGTLGSGLNNGGRHFRALDPGHRVQRSGFRIQGSGFRVQGSGFRVQGSEFRVQGSGLRVQGAGLRVHGSGFRLQ